MNTNVVESVKSKYGAVAQSNLSTTHDGVRAVAEAFGYTPAELAAIPAGANMGLSCGNPTAMANLRPGEVVVVRRFGRALPLLWTQGPHLAWPLGIDRIDRVRVDVVRRLEVGLADLMGAAPGEDAVRTALRRALERSLAAELLPGRLTQAEQSGAERLAAERYGVGCLD